MRVMEVLGDAVQVDGIVNTDCDRVLLTDISHVRRPQEVDPVVRHALTGPPPRRFPTARSSGQVAATVAVPNCKYVGWLVSAVPDGWPR